MYLCIYTIHIYLYTHIYTYTYILGSLLFTIYIDSLLNFIDIPTSAYAGDFKFVANLLQYSLM